MKILIIGNGISGITAARHIRKLSDHEITVISKETEHFYSRTALMYIYMGHMRFEDTKPYEDWFWKKNRINLIQNTVTKIHCGDKELELEGGEKLTYDKLIIASGSKSNYFGWPGQELKGVQGLYNIQDLETLENYSKDMHHAVIVGGGLIGVELAEMLHSRGIPVTFLVREASFWDNVLPPGESEIINKHLIAQGINLMLEKNLARILPDEKGRVRAVKVKETGEEIGCNFVGLTAGVSPNVDFVKSCKIETNRGVLVNGYFESNIKDVYAIGDCAEFQKPPGRRRAVEQVWYSGRMHGERLAQNICGNLEEYKPCPWYNSAKFFDIEYQTYGMILAKLCDNEAEIYWENEDHNKCIHIVYDKISKVFIGVNTLGIRLRHHLFDQWLREKKSVEYVLEHLKTANFDPEFFELYEEDLLKIYNEKEKTNIKSKGNRLFKNVLNLMKK